MAQHDYVIANGTGAAVRSDLNNALAAIVSQNSGATEPATTYAFQFWADTATSTLKLRNSANNAWIELMQLDGTLTMEDGTEALPGLSFRNDLDTGLWRPGANQLAISTNAVERVEFGASEVVFNDGGANYDFRVEGDTNANLLFVDASADAVGIGTNSPGAKLSIQDGNTVDVSGSAIRMELSGSNPYWEIQGLNGANSAGRKLNFYTSSLGGANVLTLLQSGNVGIGTATPVSILDVTVGGGGVRKFLANYDDSQITIKGANATSDPEVLRIVADNIRFNTGTTGSGTERARIDLSGRLLVGTSTSLRSTALIQSKASSGTHETWHQSDSLANEEFCRGIYVSGSRSGQVGVFKHSGITNPAGFLYVQREDSTDAWYWTDNSGNFRVSSTSSNIGTTGGTVVGTQTSDERIKNILGPVEYGLDTIKQIEPVRYALKSEPDVEKLGFIAQQVQPLVPQSVFDTNEHIEGEPEDAPTKLGMEYVSLIPVLVNAIKELSAEVDALKAQLAQQS